VAFRGQQNKLRRHFSSQPNNSSFKSSFKFATDDIPVLVSISNSVDCSPLRFANEAPAVSIQNSLLPDIDILPLDSMMALSRLMAFI